MLSLVAPQMWMVSVAKGTACLEHRIEMVWDESIRKPPFYGLIPVLPKSTINFFSWDCFVLLTEMGAIICPT